MGIGRLFDISVRSMSAYQSAIGVSSQNISNANNADYTRQKVLLASEVTQAGQGMGVKVQDVVRIRDSMLDTQILKYQSTLSDAEKRSTILQQIESIVAEPSENGLAEYMTAFFSSWDQLSTNPNSVQLRLNVIQKAQNLSERFKENIAGFSDVQAVLQRDAAIKIDSINSQLKELNSISERIYESESRKVNSNDLKDQRDAMIAKLSELANVSVSTNDKGIVLINIGGVYGADQSGANEFELKIINGQMRMVSKKDSNAIAFLNGGELSAIADLYSNKIPSYKANLEKVANAFINKVNELHQSGNTLVQGGVSSTNIPFFGELDAGGKVVNAFIDGEIKINSSILNNPKNIAASDAAGNDGNGTIANKIARLLDTKIPELNNQTLLEGYIDSLNVLGSDKVFSDNKIESSGSVLEQLKNQKTSYSGVSMDEEMTNVLKYQRSYDAAAKMIKIADEMIQTILQLV